MSDTDPGTPPRTAQWRPSNDVEDRLLDAATAGDLAEMLRIVAGAPLLLPGFEDVDAAYPDEDRRRLMTRARDGVPYVLAFTSPETLHRTVEADGWRLTTLTELAGGIPEGWGLAIDPATPVVVLVQPEAVADLVPTRASVAHFVPANEVERLLTEALVSPDPQVALDVLVISSVIVPVRAIEVDGVPTVAVFTSPERYDDFLAGRDLDVRTVTMDLVAVLRQWPGPEYRLGVNLGSPISLSLRGERVAELLRYAENLAHRLRERPPAGTAEAAPERPDTTAPPLPPVRGDIGDLLRGSG